MTIFVSKDNSFLPYDFWAGTYSGFPSWKKVTIMRIAFILLSVNFFFLPTHASLVPQPASLHTSQDYICSALDLLLTYFVMYQVTKQIFFLFLFLIITTYKGNSCCLYRGRGHFNFLAIYSYFKGSALCTLKNQ